MKVNLQIVIACLDPPSIFNFYETWEAAEANLARANSGKIIPAGDYVVTTWAEYAAARRAYYMKVPLVEISGDDWHEALYELPPILWKTYPDGVESFCCAEFVDGPFTRQYAHLRGRYFTRLVAVTDTSTFITAAEIREKIDA